MCISQASQAVLWVVFATISASSLWADYKLIAQPETLSPGESATFAVTGDPQQKDFTLAAPGLVCPAPASQSAPHTCIAPKAPAAGLAVTGTVKVTATFPDASQIKPITTTVTLVGEFDVSKRGPWEGRVVIGYH